MAGLYLAGEQVSIAEASIVIGFEPHPDIVTDWEHPDYDYDKVIYYQDSYPDLLVT